MPTETVTIDGSPVVTLPKSLGAGLRAVLVGINPSPVSVSVGHYYQGKLGRRFWDRVREHGLVRWERFGFEDEDAIRLGSGFADVLRRPTADSSELPAAELARGATNVARRISTMPARPSIIFVFAKAAQYADGPLSALGCRTFRMPGPYDRLENVGAAMRILTAALKPPLS